MEKETQKPHLPQNAVKCRFFAQYWGQIYEFKNTKSKWTINEGAFPLENGDNERLILTDLKNITDEDALKCWENDNYVAKLEDIKHVQNLFTDISSRNIDYLRFKGYAVPYMEYSVEDLISFDWVRLS